MADSLIGREHGQLNINHTHHTSIEEHNQRTVTHTHVVSKVLGICTIYILSGWSNTFVKEKKKEEKKRKKKDEKSTYVYIQ